MNAVTHSEPLPWYREPWPWILIALPATAVVGCAITLYLALASADGMVARDYYKRGLSINSELARTQRAAQLGLQADVELDGFGGDRVRVRLSAARALPAETALRLSFVHPARDGADRTLVLGRVSGDAGHAEYAGQFSESRSMPSVAWQVVLESPSWRLDGQMRAHDGRRIRLEAERP
jgi:hypothetical protein